MDPLHAIPEVTIVKGQPGDNHNPAPGIKLMWIYLLLTLVLSTVGCCLSIAALTKSDGSANVSNNAFANVSAKVSPLDIAAAQHGTLSVPYQETLTAGELLSTMAMKLGIEVDYLVLFNNGAALDDRHPVVQRRDSTRVSTTPSSPVAATRSGQTMKGLGI